MNTKAHSVLKNTKILTLNLSFSLRIEIYNIPILSNRYILMFIVLYYN